MKWDELPEVYRNLDLGQNKSLYDAKDTMSNNIAVRFNWHLTPQNVGFWDQCCFALKKTGLPKIKKYWVLPDYLVKAEELQYIEREASDYASIAGITGHAAWNTINHPQHYGGKNNPYEAIKVIEAHDLNFCLGNVIKYTLRAGKKGDALEDLKKAQWYINREIERLEKHDLNNCHE